MSSGNVLEVILKLPLIGRLLSAILLYGRVFVQTVKSPINYIPQFTTEKTTTLPLAIEILLVGLIVVYLSYLPYLDTAGKLVAQLVSLIIVMSFSLFLMAAVHVALKLLGAATTLRETSAFWIISIGIIYPIHSIVIYLIYTLTKRDGLLQGYQLQLENTSRELAILLIVFIVLCLYFLQFVWMKKVYKINYLRCFIAIMIVGSVVRILYLFV